MAEVDQVGGYKKYYDQVKYSRLFAFANPLVRVPVYGLPLARPFLGFLGFLGKWAVSPGSHIDPTVGSWIYSTLTGPYKP